MSNFNFSRRRLLKTSAAASAGIAAPTIFTSQMARAYTNEPKGGTVTLGFNVPQTGPYAEEGLDELRAQELAVEHINGMGDGGALNTFSSKALGQVDDRKRWRDHDQWRLVFGRGCCGSGSVSGSWRDLYGGSDPRQ